MNRLVCFLTLIIAGAGSTAFGAETATLWKNRCAKCHGIDGRGDTKEGHKRYINDLTDRSIQEKFSDKEAADSIKFGLKDAKGRTIMKAVRGLSDGEVNSLVAYVRSLKR